MKTSIVLVALSAVLAATSPVFADAGHDDYAVGVRADKGKSKRTITITMRETDDGKMIFEPKKLQFREGETVTLNFINKGDTDHEFVMDTEANVLAHKVEMEKNPDMEHDDDNSLRLAPGAKGQIIWTFSKPGEYSFACLIPGHYESGMHGPLKVTKK